MPMKSALSVSADIPIMCAFANRSRGLIPFTLLKIARKYPSLSGDMWSPHVAYDSMSVCLSDVRDVKKEVMDRCVDFAIGSRD